MAGYSPLDPFGSATRAFSQGLSVMGLLQQTQNNQHRFDDQSDRDLLITLAVQMEHVKRTITALTWAVGFVLAGIVPFSLILVVYAAALLALWQRSAP